jgi:hypothetical protein
VVSAHDFFCAINIFAMNEDLLCALLLAAVVILILYNFYPPEGASMPKNQNVLNNMGYPLSQEQIPNSSMRQRGAEMKAIGLRKRIKPAPQTIPRMGGRIGFGLGNAGK